MYSFKIGGGNEQIAKSDFGTVRNPYYFDYFCVTNELKQEIWL